MINFTAIINQVLPILLLLCLGSVIRSRALLAPETMVGIQKIVVNLALPALLFSAFTKIDLKISYLTLSAVIFSSCIVLFLLGKVHQKLFASRHLYQPYLTTGFEYGMLGVSLFGGAYGLQHIGYIAIVDLGHELFIWFVLFPLLLAQRDGKQNSRAVAQSFLKNPVVLAIVLGVIVNVCGLTDTLTETAVLGGLVKCIELLTGMTIPLILIVVGYGIRFKGGNIKEALRFIAFRYSLVIPFAFCVNVVLIRNILHLEKAFEIAVYTLFLLPSPFIIPLFMKEDMVIEKEYINNILALQTLLTIAIFTVFLIFHPTLY